MSETKPMAVVTGASSGIGLELAKQFAEHGFDLLVCAEDPGVRAVGGQLQEFGTDVTPVAADLSKFDGVEQLYRAIVSSGRPVSAAALNAGVGLGGPFLE